MFETLNGSEVIENKRNSPTGSRFFSSTIKSVSDLVSHVQVDLETDCWNWIHGKTSEGYGRARRNGGPIDAHRLAWVLKHGDVLTSDMFICHTCDNPACCNPEHLFLGSVLINNQDSKKKGRRMHQKMTTCVNGHPRIEENLYKYKRKDGRLRIECKICHHEQANAAYARKTRGFVDE